MTTHISIDIETPATSPSSAIVQIGVAVMDHKGEIFNHKGRNFKIDITEYDSYPQFDVSIGTMMWWATQDQEAFREAFGVYNPSGMNGVNEDRNSLALTMQLLCEHIRSIEGKIRVWAKPPSFDLVIIQHALKVTGYKCPWSFRDERCLRTLLDLTPRDASIHGMPFEGAKHDAYADAVHQLKQIRACLTVAGRMRHGKS